MQLTTSMIVSDFLYGVVLALFFVWIPVYPLRTMLCTFAPVAFNWWILWLLSDPVSFRTDMQTLIVALGGFCAAQAVSLPSLVRYLKQRDA